MSVKKVDSTSLIGEVSQSGQWAPFNPWYSVSVRTFLADDAEHEQFINTSSSDYAIYDDTITAMNPYQGGD